MPQSITEVNRGDLAKALKKLKPTNEQTRLAIAQALGMGWDPPKKSKAPGKEKRIEGPAVTSGRLTRNVPLFEQLQAPNRALVSLLEHQQSEDPTTSIYVEPLQSSPPESETQSPPHEPLFLPRWTRGILNAALATDSEIGNVDIDRAVRTLAKGHALVELPLLSTPTLARGVQLLIDRSEAMVPFIRDQMILHEQIAATVGQDRVTTLRFVGCPTRSAGPGPAATWSTYEAPLNGGPVLLLTDLGVGKPALSDERAGAEEWLDFVRIVKKAKCPLIAFVPYGESRWPQKLRGHMSIIQWDRNTTANSVSNRLKGAGAPKSYLDTVKTTSR